MSMGPIVALEIGTSRVRVFVGEVRGDDELTITAVGDCASSGIASMIAMAVGILAARSNADLAGAAMASAQAPLTSEREPSTPKPRRR